MLQVSVQADFLLLGFVKTERWDTREQIQVARSLWDQIRMGRLCGFMTPRSFDQVCRELSAYPNAQEVITAIRAVLEVLPHNPSIDEAAAISGSDYDCAVELAYAKEYELDGIITTRLSEFSEFPEHEIAIFLPGALLLELQEMNAFDQAQLGQLRMLYAADEARSSEQVNSSDDTATNSTLSDEEIVLEIIRRQTIYSGVPTARSYHAATEEQPETDFNLNLAVSTRQGMEAKSGNLFASSMISQARSFSQDFEATDFSAFWLPSVFAIAAIDHSTWKLSSQSYREQNMIVLPASTSPMGTQESFIKPISTTAQEFLGQHSHLALLSQLMANNFDPSVYLFNSQDNHFVIHIDSAELIAAKRDNTETNRSIQIKAYKTVSELEGQGNSVDKTDNNGALKENIQINLAPSELNAISRSPAASSTLPLPAKEIVSPILPVLEPPSPTPIAVPGLLAANPAQVTPPNPVPGPVDPSMAPAIVPVTSVDILVTPAPNPNSAETSELIYVPIEVQLVLDSDPDLTQSFVTSRSDFQVLIIQLNPAEPKANFQQAGEFGSIRGIVYEQRVDEKQVDEQRVYQQQSAELVNVVVAFTEGSQLDQQIVIRGIEVEQEISPSKVTELDYDRSYSAAILLDSHQMMTFAKPILVTSDIQKPPLPSPSILNALFHRT